jgi:hypothetical protein
MAIFAPQRGAFEKSPGEFPFFNLHNCEVSRVECGPLLRTHHTHAALAKFFGLILR